MKECPIDQPDFSKSLMYSVHQMYFLVQKNLEQSLSKIGTLSFSQFLVLVGFRCSMSGPVSQAAIAERLHITEATVSRHISTLVDLGYLERKEDPTNRRKHSITITSQGTKAFIKAKSHVDKELESLFSSISEKDRACIMRNFEQVLTLLAKK